jgi:hypothetical protein
MGIRWLSSLVAALTLTACADLVTPVAHSSAVPPTAVRITIVPRDVHGQSFLHAVVRFVRITGAETRIERQLDPDGDTRVILPAAGDYRLRSWARPCASTCADLDPPTDRCTTTFTAVLGEVVELEIRSPLGGGCAVAVTG